MLWSKKKKCIRKSTCKINQIFNEKTESCENKKCKAVLEYYSQHKQKCEKKPVCKSGQKFNENSEKCETGSNCKTFEYYSEKNKK